MIIFLLYWIVTVSTILQFKFDSVSLIMPAIFKEIKICTIIFAHLIKRFEVCTRLYFLL